MNKKTNSKGKSNKGKRVYSKEKYRDKNKDALSREMEYDTRLSSKDRDNDPNWYFLSKEVADQTGSISFDSYLGVSTPVDILTESSNIVETHEASIHVPTILALHMNPCPGDTSDVKRGINIAALKTFTTLSANNAKTTQYAPQDISTLILAMGEVVSMIEHIRRAFGVAFTYNQRNRDLPRKLLDEMGFNPDDFLTNLADHRLEFNSLITAINKIPFVDGIAYIYKCADMYQKVYTDSESMMAQISFMRPYSTWVLNEVGSEQGTTLETRVLPNIGGSWNDWMSIINQQVQQLFESSTYNYIYADILNYSAKFNAKLAYLDYLLEGYSVIPEYNRNYWLQVHNATIVGTPFNDASQALPSSYTLDNNVYPDVNKNKLQYRPLVYASNTYSPQSNIVDFDIPNPSIEDRIEATRYQAIVKPYGTLPDYPLALNEPIALPDHYVVLMRIASTMGSVESLDLTTSILDDTSIGTLPSYISMAQFDWNPIMWYVTHLSDKNPYDITLIGDVNFFTMLNQKWYSRVNDLTFQGLFTLR